MTRLRLNSGFRVPELGGRISKDERIDAIMMKIEFSANAFPGQMLTTKWKSGIVQIGNRSGREELYAYRLPKPKT